MRQNTASVVKQNVKKRESVDMPAGENLLDLLLGKRLSIGASFQFHASLCQNNLIFGEIPSTSNLGDIGKEEETRTCDWERDDGVDDEEPLPTLVPMFSAQLVDSRHQITRKHGSDTTTGVEDTGTFR